MPPHACDEWLHANSPFGIGNLGIELMTHKVDVVQSLDHPAGIILLDIKQRVTGHQVDSTHIDTRSGTEWLSMSMRFPA